MSLFNHCSLLIPKQDKRLRHRRDRFRRSEWQAHLQRAIERADPSEKLSHIPSQSFPHDPDESAPREPHTECLLQKVDSHI